MDENPARVTLCSFALAGSHNPSLRTRRILPGNVSSASCTFHNGDFCLICASTCERPRINGASAFPSRPGAARSRGCMLAASHLFPPQPARCVWAPECLMQRVGGGDEQPQHLAPAGKWRGWKFRVCRAAKTRDGQQCRRRTWLDELIMNRTRGSVCLCLCKIEAKMSLLTTFVSCVKMFGSECYRNQANTS